MELLTREEVLNIARNVADDKNVLLQDYEVANKSERILGYLGKHLALTLHVASEKGKTERVFFVKTYEAGENVEDFLGETGLFKREQDFYRIVLSGMQKYVANLDWCPEYRFGKERVLAAGTGDTFGDKGRAIKAILSTERSAKDLQIYLSYSCDEEIATTRLDAHARTDCDKLVYKSTLTGIQNVFKSYTGRGGGPLLTQGPQGVKGIRFPAHFTHSSYRASMDSRSPRGSGRQLSVKDLSEKGFKMVDNGQRSWALDNAHLERALETLASMHATSIFLESREALLLPDLYPMVFRREILYDENKPETPTRKWIRWQIQDLLEGVDYLDKYSYDQKKLIKENFEKEIMRIYSLSKKSEKYRNTLTHGDMWKNNLLFRYSKEKTPTECRFVDFQFIRYAPPAHDVMHLLHYATVKEARDRKESGYLEFYYGHLRKRMQNLGIKIEKEISGEDFIKSCKEYKELALIQSLLSLHYILGPATLTIDMKVYTEYEDYLANHRKEYMNHFFHDETYADKIQDTFHELIDTYILEK